MEHKQIVWQMLEVMDVTTRGKHHMPYAGNVGNTQPARGTLCDPVHRLAQVHAWM